MLWAESTLRKAVGPLRTCMPVHFLASGQGCATGPGRSLMAPPLFSRLAEGHDGGLRGLLPGCRLLLLGREPRAGVLARLPLPGPPCSAGTRGQEGGRGRGSGSLRLGPCGAAASPRRPPLQRHAGCGEDPGGELSLKGGVNSWQPSAHWRAGRATVMGPAEPKAGGCSLGGAGSTQNPHDPPHPPVVAASRVSTHLCLNV